MQKWDYRIETFEATLSTQRQNPEMNQELNRLGQDGWELVNTQWNLGDNGATFVFKRPI